MDTKKWVPITFLDHQDLIHRDFDGRFAYACRPDFKMSKNGAGNGFLCIFDNNGLHNVPDDIKSAHKSIVMNTTAESKVSWVAKFTLADDVTKRGARPMTPIDPAKESVLIHGDSCWSIYEYSPGRMLLAAKSCILNLKDW